MRYEIRMKDMGFFSVWGIIDVIKGEWTNISFFSRKKAEKALASMI